MNLQVILKKKLPKFEEFQKVMQEVQEMSFRTEKIEEDKKSPESEKPVVKTQQKDQLQIQYQSIQETLKDLQDLKLSGSGFKSKRSEVAQSAQDYDLNYSETTSHFS
jgi:hypothetical protein